MMKSMPAELDAALSNISRMYCSHEPSPQSGLVSQPSVYVVTKAMLNAHPPMIETIPTP